LNLILADYKKHRAVGETTYNEDLLEPIEGFTQEQLQGKETIEKNGKKFVKSVVQKK
jgi:hypothetical protein